MPILQAMATQLDDTLASAALNDRERLIIIESLLGRLREEVGDDLLAVWLYGSRARAEADPTVTDPDRRSDVNLLAIAEGGDERYDKLILYGDSLEGYGTRRQAAR